MRGATNRILLLFLLMAGVAPLTCVVPIAGHSSRTGLALLAAYGVGILAAITTGVRSMRRESRQLTAYDAELRGLCAGCGYDMRATPDRCPECGRVVGEGFE